MNEEIQYTVPSAALIKKASKFLENHLSINYTDYVRDSIKDSYNESYKKYHNWEHIVRIIADYFKWYGKLDGVDMIPILETAIWHDIICVPGSKNNERFSQNVYRVSTFYSDFRVARCIETSKDHWNRSSNLTEWEHRFLDMDLIGFVENPRLNSAKIYQECKPFFGTDQIVAGRKKFFEHIVQYDNFFVTLPKEVSEKAIENIRLELEKLNKITGTHTFYTYYSWLLNDDTQT